MGEKEGNEKLSKNGEVASSDEDSCEVSRSSIALCRKKPKTLKQVTMSQFFAAATQNIQRPSRNDGPQTLRILSYNIDMDTAPIGARTRCILQMIRKLRPDVILCQEVTPESFRILSPLWTLSEAGKLNYSLHTGKDWSENPYFCIMLLRKELFSEVEHQAVLFPTSQMMRGYITATGMLPNGTTLTLATSHLESLKPYTEERKHQLQTVLNALRNVQSEDHGVIFAGDTNLRENEVPANEIQKTKVISKKRSRVEKFQDAFLKSNAGDDDKYTWDTQKNDNLNMNGRIKPKARYDRMFYLPESLIGLESFQLIGKERLECGPFPSDHFGMLVELSIEATKN